MIFILSDSDTPRLRYAFRYLLEEGCGLGCVFVHSTAEIPGFPDVPVIDYSRNPLKSGFRVAPAGILARSDLQPEVICLDRMGEWPIFFSSPGADFPFDIFGASFYLLSRYEEYLPGNIDAYGRYDHRQSLACQSGFLDIPLIECWMMEFRRALAAYFPSILLTSPVFRFSPSYDVDIAYAYGGRGLARTAGSLIRPCFRGDWNTLADRWRVWRGSSSDPYDVYAMLDALHTSLRLEPRYFFLLASECRGLDRNLDPASTAMQALLHRHAERYALGMHPSWQSGDDPSVFRAEKERLEGFTGKPVLASRQHYLRMILPETYQRLRAQGIREDHSMGYGAVNGFRASVSRAFPWYDLSADCETDLRVHPFCFMDATGYHELRQTSEQACQQLAGYLHILRRVGGCMSTIFHNSMLGRSKMYAGWSDMYIRFLRDVAD